MSTRQSPEGVNRRAENIPAAGLARNKTVFDDPSFANNYDVNEIARCATGTLSTYTNLTHSLLRFISPDQPVQAIVDLGAGTGISTKVLAEHFQSSQIVAIEPSKAMIERLQVNLAATPALAKIVNKDAYSGLLETEDKSQDLVLANQSIHWFALEQVADSGKPSLRYLEEVLTQVARVLKQHGMFLFSTQGASFALDEKLSERHFHNHPFYRQFTKNFFKILWQNQDVKQYLQGPQVPDIQKVLQPEHIATVLARIGMKPLHVEVIFDKFGKEQILAACRNANMPLIQMTGLGHLDHEITRGVLDQALQLALEDPTLVKTLDSEEYGELLVLAESTRI